MQERTKVDYSRATCALSPRRMDAPDEQTALAFSFERVLPDLALLCENATDDDVECERALSRLTRAVSLRGASTDSERDSSTRCRSSRTCSIDTSTTS